MFLLALRGTTLCVALQPASVLIVQRENVPLLCQQQPTLGKYILLA